jgi:hypothetical protein
LLLLNEPVDGSLPGICVPAHGTDQAGVINALAFSADCQSLFIGASQVSRCCLCAIQLPRSCILATTELRLNCL